MHAMHPTLVVALILLLPAVGAILLAQVMRRAPIPELAGLLLGGALAGVLLGASVLGVVAPDFFSAVFVGAEQERAQLIEAQRAHERDMLVMIESDVSDVAIAELQSLHDQEIQSLEQAVEIAERERRQISNTIVTSLFAALLLTGALRSSGRPRNSYQPPSGAIGAAICMLLIAGGPTLLLSRWTLGIAPDEQLAFALCCAIGAAYPTIAGQRAAGEARDLIVLLASALAMLIGLVALAGLMNSTEGAVIFGCAVGGLVLGRFLRPTRTQRRALRAFANVVLIPALAAAAMVYIDLTALVQTRTFWIATVIAVIFASDGRWLGGWLGWWTGGGALGRAYAWRRSSAMLSGEVGPVAVGCIGALAGAGLLSPPLACGAMIGAIGVEITAGVRAQFARSLDRGELFSVSEDAD